eukprot:GEMP01051310.1.p1 GENE.GEMP01051310.1~~GEMP01051310.1.p1  ORF type:complete len:268 (+),score=29.90 GEMP01051310.1:138-941(+)
MVLATIIGWAYVLAWSVSFYPQVILNYQRKKTTGLSTEYLWYNIIGFSVYGIYNQIIFNAEVAGDHSVQLNDLFFCYHAWLLSAITLAQIPWYGGQPFNLIYPHDYILLLLLLCIAIATILDLAQVIPTLADASQDLSLVMFFGTLKACISVSKYIPQVLLNYNRQSTKGFSIENILLDLTGGALSLVQVFMMCACNQSWSDLTGNPIKVVLGLLSIGFDLLFMVQHYVLYRHDHGESSELEEALDPLDAREMATINETIIDEEETT